MEDVAERLGVRVGDTVTAIGPTDAERSLRVTATYGRPRADDPFWFGSQTPIPEAEGADLPPGLLSREGYLALSADLGLASQYVWDLYLDLGGALRRRAARPGAIRRDVAALQEVPELAEITVSTGLGALFELTRQRVADLRVPILLVVFQVAAVALAILAGVGSLVLSRQSFELAVLEAGVLARQAARGPGRPRGAGGGRRLPDRSRARARARAARDALERPRPCRATCSRSS